MAQNPPSREQGVAGGRQPPAETKMDFVYFCSIARPPQDIALELEPYFDKSDTIGRFFQNIPKEERCRLVRDWINTFMSQYLQDVIENVNWVIRLPMTTGGRKTRKYYRPNGKIHFRKPIYDIGVTPDLV